MGAKMMNFYNQMLKSIEIKTEFNASSNSVTIESTTEILESISGPLSLNVIVTESHIIAYQTDYEADQEIADYEHNHVMRKTELLGCVGSI